MAVTRDEMLTALKVQRESFTNELPVSAASRKDRLKRLIAMIVDHRTRWTDALSEDFGHRSVDQSEITDLVGSVGPAKHALANLEKWMRPEKRKVQFPLGLLGAKGVIEYQPKGVVGIIAPWNFPVNLTCSPMAGAFAAGNRVMIKSSEFTPTVAALFEELGKHYYDPAEAIFFSGGPDVGQAFAGLPFDHLIFTGATGIGKHILHAAADNLTPVTLELGGKSPTIIGRSADVAQATQRITMGKMMNAGQICLAPDYLMVPKEKESEVVEGMKSAVSLLYPKLLDNPDYTSVINARHRDRLKAYLVDAQEKGAEIVEVNPANEDFEASNGNKMPLYIVRNPTDDMKVMQEEIFGPVLPIKTYERVEEAIDYVNRNDRPLGLYYFGQQESEQRQVLDRTISGGVTVNDVIMHVSMEDLPFGGIGPSGMGSYHGHDGFKTFSHAKSIYKQPKINVTKLAGFMPPYGDATRKSVARELKA